MAAGPPDGLSPAEECYFAAQTAAEVLAARCVDLHLIGRVTHGRDLETVINYLMTELWDRGFTRTQIANAFERAAADLPRYSAGEESNGRGLG